MTQHKKTSKTKLKKAAKVVMFSYESCGMPHLFSDTKDKPPTGYYKTLSMRGMTSLNKNHALAASKGLR